ncbi:MAG: prenyltransferase/squalene oxidase repeat-containing protein [Candidatus Ornithomonoglobus sp.]
MKKTAAVVPALLVMLVSVTANAAYSQYDIQTAVEKAFEWHEQNASPRNSAGSIASDFYIMSLARMGKSYDFDSYIRLTEKLNPTTQQDGQRLVMTSAACGERLSNSFVGWYTWQQDNASASELAGTIITLDSGQYTIPEGEGDINNLVGALLTTQQSNGSFGNDIVTTAKSIIALSTRANTEYHLSGTHDNELYKYNTGSAIENALSYLSSCQQSDGGFTTVSNTAYVIAALDSIGTDSDADPAFVKNGATPLSFLFSQQGDNGSIASSPDDTAMMEMAYVSRLRAMQGKAAFFSFMSGDSVAAASSDSTENHSGESIISSDGESSSAAASSASSDSDSSGSTGSTKEIISLTPPPTKEPEHSAVSEEEYGPFQFVGPVQQTDKPDKNYAVKTENKEEEEPVSGSTIAIIAAAIIAALALAGFIILTVISRNPEMKKKLEDALSDAKKKASELKDRAKKTEQQPESNNIIDEIDSSHEVVPTEELYDPDFIKKLIPVDEIDMSIDSLIPTEDNPLEENDDSNLSEDSVKN